MTRTATSPRRRPWFGAIPRRRQGRADRATNALRRHRRLLDLQVRRQRSPHLRGARPQRHRHRPRHQHCQRVGREHATPASVTRRLPRAEQPARHLGHRNQRHDRVERRHRQPRCRRLRPVPRLQPDGPDPADHRLPISGLSCGTAYQVGVDAYDAAGNTSPQATIVGHHDAPAPTASRPPHPATSPPPPAPPPASPSPGRPPPTTSASPATASTTAADLVNTTTGTTGIVSGLTCGTNYTLSVDAFDASGNSSPKTTIMVSTLPCTDTTPPTQPTNLRLVH